MIPPIIWIMLGLSIFFVTSHLAVWFFIWFYNTVDKIIDKETKKEIERRNT